VNWIVIPLALLTACSTFAGGYVALRLSHELQTVIALTGGVVVAVALFHVLPEAIEIVDDPARVGGLVGFGFIAFFLAEARARPAPPRRHGARPGARAGRRARRGGLSIHSFIDGLGIGLAFNIDTATGFLVSSP
jgi:ZIP family zinc transporter